MGLTPNSPLITTLLASNIALPAIVRYVSVLSRSAQFLEDASSVMAPSCIELGREHQFHSVFVCPVSKDQGTHDNPPVLLKCGHVISHSAMNKMLRSRLNRAGRIKCPTCPKEQNPSEVVTLYF